MSIREAVIEIDENGAVHTAAEALELLKSKRFRMRVEDARITLEPTRPRLSQIEDPVARQRAYEEFVNRVVRKTNASLPDDWATIRDMIYD